MLFSEVSHNSITWFPGRFWWRLMICWDSVMLAHGAGWL